MNDSIYDEMFFEELIMLGYERKVAN